MILEDRDFWLWLTRLKDISKRDIIMFLMLGYNPKRLFFEDENILRDEVFKSYNFKVDISTLIRSRIIKDVELYKASLIGKGISYLTIDDDDYPVRLLHLYDKVFVLYYKGEPKKMPLNIAVVGARKSSVYARTVADKFSRDLAKCGVNIVSGLAYGIDSSAHIAALEVGGYTTAVVGCGFDYCYPAGNKKLMDKIVKNGVVYSEYPPDIHPSKFTFPMRNRIISALSDGVLLVEARLRSGSLITVNHALEIGRDIFAVPLDILGKSNEGGNQVIREGGKIVFNYMDILEEYPSFIYDMKSDNLGDLHIAKKPPADTATSMKSCTDKAMAKKSSYDNATSTKSYRANDEAEKQDSNLKKELEINLSADEKKVYSLIEYHPIFLDDLVERTGLAISQVQLYLMKLEMKGLVRAVSSKRYVRMA